MACAWQAIPSRAIEVASLAGFRHGHLELDLWAQAEALRAAICSPAILRHVPEDLRVRSGAGEDLRLSPAALQSQSVFVCANRLVTQH